MRKPGLRDAIWRRLSAVRAVGRRAVSAVVSTKKQQSWSESLPERAEELVNRVQPLLPTMFQSPLRRLLGLSGGEHAEAGTQVDSVEAPRAESVKARRGQPSEQPQVQPLEGDARGISESSHGAPKSNLKSGAKDTTRLPRRRAAAKTTGVQSKQQVRATSATKPRALRTRKTANPAKTTHRLPTSDLRSTQGEEARLKEKTATGSRQRATIPARALRDSSATSAPAREAHIKEHTSSAQADSRTPVNLSECDEAQVKPTAAPRSRAQNSGKNPRSRASARRSPQTPKE